ncbi:unnamed protein product [Acanthoscelides obtectus]|uniref:GCS light chain n=1 Tax=Acanthoscelides obtectus TaxID=200917 RepID=A0A9P0JT37_ACAOB|nr:unnamed protein product [Acanthoscelides obtectus]CAK1671269.1 Glutamate--cysteine ligase regulatory subunit [Acanthoscelides obtectus]
MAKHNKDNLKNVIINTGNILSIKDFTKKANHNTTEELVEAINCTLKDVQGALDNHLDNVVVISRQNDDLVQRIKENDVSELKIGIKIFLNGDDQVSLKEAIDKAFYTLQVNTINDAVISFKQTQLEKEQDNLAQIQTVWKALQAFVQNGKIRQIGIADVEEKILKQLYDWAEVKPSIIQINLASCCVVPPTLQAFCKDNDIKLLTHSDSNDVLPKENIQELFDGSFNVKWVLRFLTHLKCRGVLTTKGYLLCLEKD